MAWPTGNTPHTALAALRPALSAVKEKTHQAGGSVIMAEPACRRKLLPPQPVRAGGRERFLKCYTLDCT